MSLRYSKNALNVLRKFHRKDFVVYVEGDEDKLFWDSFYHNLRIDKTPVFKVAGGSNEIEKYLRDIIEKDTSIVVIRDSDYRLFLNERSTHKRDILTKGHSIENLVYSPENIAKCIAIMSGSSIYSDQETENWLVGIENSLSELQVYEIASLLQSREDIDCIAVLSDNPFSLIDTRNNPHKICDKKLEDKILEMKTVVSETLYAKAKKIYLKKRDAKKYRYVRGHFMTGLVNFYINNTIEKSDSKLTKNKIHMGSTFRVLTGFSDLKTIPRDELNYYRKAFKLAIDHLNDAV